jgi:hypothetical protein
LAAASQRSERASELAALFMSEISDEIGRYRSPFTTKIGIEKAAEPHQGSENVRPLTDSSE